MSIEIVVKQVRHVSGECSECGSDLNKKELLFKETIEYASTTIELFQKAEMMQLKDAIQIAVQKALMDVENKI